MNSLLFLIAFATGLVVKYSDTYSDPHKNKITLKGILLGITYGSLLGYTVIKYPFIAPLWIGTILGVLFTGKIDAIPHYVGIGTFVVLVALFGSSSLNVALLIIFTLACILEEIVNDFFDKKKIKNKILSNIVKSRPILELTALAVGLVTGNIAIWLALLSHDAGYILAGKIKK